MELREFNFTLLSSFKGMVRAAENRMFWAAQRCFVFEKTILQSLCLLLFYSSFPQEVPEGQENSIFLYEKQ